VVVIEVNGNLPEHPSVTIPRYPPWRLLDDSFYYGANFSAMCRLGRAKSYTIVHNRLSLNLFFVRSDLLHPAFDLAVPFVRSVTHRPDPQNREWYFVRDEDLVVA
jgi:hypothetical protein